MKADKIKILIATGIYPPDIGGPATMLPALSAALRERGFEVKIITYSSITSQPNDRGQVYRLIKDRWFSRPFYFLKLLQLSFGAQVIYVMDVYSVGYFAYVVSKLTGKKYVVRFVGDSAWETAVGNGWTSDYIVDFQEKTYDAKIEKLKTRRKTILLGAAKVVVVSKFIGSIAEKIGVSKDKIELIYNSVDFIDQQSDKRLVAEIRRQYGQEAKIIVTACRLTVWKGVDGIIRILPELTRRLGKVNFLVLGEGPALVDFKNLAQKLAVETSVHFLGKIDHRQILDYFRAADLFILNTNYEALSHTLLEVMTVGAPIVATNIGGNPEVIEHQSNGLLVDYNNQAELMAATEKILTGKNLAKDFSINAKIKLPQFSWSLLVEKTAALFNQLVS